MTKHLQAGLYERFEAPCGYRSGWRRHGVRTQVRELELGGPTNREGTFASELFRRMERNKQAHPLD